MKGRPAETAGAVVGTGGIVASIASHNWLALAISCAGYLPAGVTYVVAHGGLKGVARSIWGK